MVGLYSSEFCYCCSSNDGGAIYFCNSPNTVLKNVCSYRCSCGNTSYYNFGIIGGQSINTADLCSVIQCSNNDGNGYYSVCFMNGNQMINSINSSNNRVISHSGASFWNVITRTVKYCTFANNNASQSICVSQGQNKDHSARIEYTNIVNNNSPSSGVVFTHHGIQYLSNFIFYMNSNTLFSSQYGSISVEKSYIDHNSSYLDQYTKLNSVLFTQTNTFEFTFYLCRFPFRTNEETPLSSPVETPFISLEITPISTNFETLMMTNEKTIIIKTPWDTRYPVQTLHPTLFPVQTPHQSLFPMHTPYDTHYPERTNERSFLSDNNERITSTSTEESKNSSDQGYTGSLFMYSTLALAFILVFVFAHNIGSKKSSNNDQYSSSSSISSRSEAIIFENEKIEHQTSKQRKHNWNNTNPTSKPYVF